MSNMQKFDFLTAGSLNHGDLRDEINRLFHAEEGELVKRLLRGWW